MYDTFLHQAQQAKMRELWDNEEDEVFDELFPYFNFTAVP